MVKLLFISCLLLTACRSHENSTENNIIKDADSIVIHSSSAPVTKVWVDRLTKREYSLPDTIGNKPVSFYLNSPKVATIAKALYIGQFRPEDTDSTTSLLALISTEDSTIRPFYRWCLDFTIRISDGALAEYPGKPALLYASKYPKEFFVYMDKDKTGLRYKRWTEIISYSGLYDYTAPTSTIRNEIMHRMKVNCKDCPDSIVNRIKSFASEIVNGIKASD